MEEPIAVDLRDFVSFELDGGAWRRVLATDVVAVDIVALEPRQSLPARTFADADVIYTVLGGAVWVVTGDSEVTLEALQAVMIPAGEPHGLQNNSADPLILQVVISPPDEEPGEALLPAPGDQARADPDPAAHPPRSRLLDRVRRTLGGP